MSRNDTPDIVLTTPKGVVLGEIRHRFDLLDLPLLFDRFEGYSDRHGIHPRFLLIGDPEQLRFYRASDRKEVGTLSTPAIMDTYDAKFSSEVVYESYLVTLVLSWLDDIAHHWKSVHPPGTDKLPKELVELIAA